MKKNLINGIIPILMMMVLSSCTKYDPPGPYPTLPEVLGMIFENIEFPESDNDYYPHAVIPQEGIKFTMMPVLNDDIEVASVTGVWIDLVNQEYKGYAPFNENVKLFSGEWGKVDYLNSTQPYNIEVTINPNLSGHQRLIKLWITGQKDGDVVADNVVFLIQKAE